MRNLNDILYTNISSALLSEQLIFDGATLRALINDYTGRGSDALVNVIANILLSILGAQWRLVNIDALAERLASDTNRERLGF